MLEPAHLELSGERLRVVYHLDGLDDTEARALARHICVEQTVEFPADLIPADDDISLHIIGQIEHFAESEGGHVATISYAAECTAYQLPQLMNVVFGNISLLPGIRVESLDLPASVLAAFPGPRFGVEGLRRLLNAHHRPILATALKPMGTPLHVLAEMTYDFAAAGIDLIKDDHGLSSQPFANFERRVELCTAALARANADHGTHAVYLPSLNVGADRTFQAAAMARDAGAKGALLLPGLYGYDTMRAVAADDALGLVVMSHPSMLGAFTSPPRHGMSHALVLGTLARLAGADVSVFPNHSGRFSFAPQQCAAIAHALGEPLGRLAPAFPAPAGGMTLQRIPEMVEFYGNDVVMLIGGELHRGDRGGQARAMRRAADRGQR